MPADHTGICAFCGSVVHRGFTVCSACGAVWVKVQTGMGGIFFDIARVPIALGMIGGGAWFLISHSVLGLLLAAGSLVASTFLFSSAKVWRWVRKQP